MTIQVSRSVSSTIAILAVSLTALADAADHTAASLAARDRYIAEFELARRTIRPTNAWIAHLPILKVS